jgi:hypothetical protein
MDESLVLCVVFLIENLILIYWLCYVCSPPIAYFVLQLCFWLHEEGNHQAHALEVFKHTVHKVVKDVIFYVRIQANNAYYREVLG